MVEIKVIDSENGGEVLKNEKSILEGVTSGALTRQNEELSVNLKIQV
jgi:hypothetical protein